MESGQKLVGKVRENENENLNLKTAIKKRKRKKSSKKKAKKWKSFQKTSSVYVSGLPPETTEDVLAEYFSKCGIVRKDPVTNKPKVKIYRNEKGEAKGDGLVAYLKDESVQLAVDMLDDAPMDPAYPNCRVRVERAEFKMKGDVFIAKKDETAEDKTKEMTRRRIAKTRDQRKELCWDDDEEAEFVAKAGLRIIVLKPMFDLKELKKKGENTKAFFDELGEEIGVECERIVGPIDKLTVFEKSAAGAVVVKFKTAESAAKCVAAMDGRFFSGRAIGCEYFDGTDYREKSKETFEEEKKRLENFGKWLEDAD